MKERREREARKRETEIVWRMESLNGEKTNNRERE